MPARTLAALMLALLACTAAQAQTSEEYAVMGLRAWAAFQCSTLADSADERQRFFDLGYEEGKAFIEAWQSDRIAWEDVRHRVPIEVLDRLEPWVRLRLPTLDFRLGAIWESVVRYTLHAIDTSDDPEFFANSLYRQRNCGLL